MLGAIMLITVVSLAVRAMQSEVVVLTRDQIWQNDRVRREFGDDVRIPIGMGSTAGWRTCVAARTSRSTAPQALIM